ncbi:MAG TPA: hypothetical protein ENI23_04380 [bacterium]|nr:hypothetical protein [bacterium]
MKPTKEIIELSKKISELRFRQKRKQGDWYIVPEDISITRKEEVYLCADKIPTQRDDLIPIPSLDDGLEWLKENDLYYVFVDTVVLSTCSTCIEADTPHEAVLKAMIKVMEK